MPANFTAKDLVDYLDRCVIKNPLWSFMNLQHPYIYTANSRLSLYADDARWAIVFEKNGYENRNHTITLELNFFGNCLQDLERGGADNRYTSNARYLTLIDGDAWDEITSSLSEGSWPTATSVSLRQRTVQLPATKQQYAKWVPDIVEDTAVITGRDPSTGKDINIPAGLGRPTEDDLGRYLAFEYADLCRATDAEKRSSLPADLPEIMTVDEWHHRYYHYYRNGPDEQVMGDAPSSYETFPLLAEVLVARDPSRFRPTL
ncbi:MAG TPA: hypothetical protein VFP79_13985, partial [Pseudolabrys sp.]|nr:hypothetical protein [Pseudolabrys sp.]